MKVKALLYVAFPVMVLGTLYAVLKPQRAAETTRVSAAPPALVAAAGATSASPAAATPAATAEGAASASPAAATPAADQVRVLHAKPNAFDIVVRGGRRISEPAILKVHQGDDVTFRISTDSADEFHLHGYNLHAQLTPERTATLRFTAKLTGRFGYELHRSGLEIGALEVYPQ
jgi:plastocyanin